MCGTFYTKSSIQNFLRVNFLFPKNSGSFLSGSRCLLEDWIAIDEAVKDTGKNQSTAYVQYGMLLQKYCCHANRDAQKQRGQLDQFSEAKPFDIFTSLNRHMHTDRIVYMDAGEYIGAGVRLIEPGHKSCKNVLICIKHRSKIRSVWIDGADDEAQCHTGEEEGTKLIVVFLIHKKKIQYSHGNVQKPKEIGDDKVFIKRNQVIQTCMHDVIAGSGRYRALQKLKAEQVDNGVGQYPCMTIFF